MALSASSMLADFSYRESSKITGGAMAGMMKVAGVFSKSAREPMESTVAVKGNRMARRSNTHLNLIDLDSHTITDVDLQKKTYSVMTFDEMRQVMENLAKKMKEKKKDNEAEVTFKVSADVTGKQKQIAGYDAKEVLIKMAMDVTDPKNKQSGAMVVMTDIWMADNVSGYAEVTNFSRKMAEQLNWAPGNSMFMAQPELAKGMTEAFKEVSKLNGAPVFQITVMGPEGMPAPAGDPQTAAAQQEQKPKPSVGKALGGALGGRLGGFGRKKAEPAPQADEQAQESQQAGAANAGVLIEMQTEYSAFAPTADASLFEIPAGFKQVESDMKKMK